MEIAANDVIIRVEIVRKAHPGVKLFIHGHSIGGLIAALIACNENCLQLNLVDGVILSSAPFELHSETARWWTILGVKVLNWVMPSLKITEVSFDGCSRKESVTVEEYFCFEK